MKRPLALYTAFLKVFSACSTVLRQVFVAGFSITCPVRLLEVDVGSPRPINRGQFRVDGDEDGQMIFQIGAGLYAVGRPVQKRNDEDGQIGTIQSLPLDRGALFNRFFGEPAHGPPHVAGGASGPIGGCRDESRSDNPDLDLRHVFDRNNRKTDLI